jgi:hypothetical protein
MRKLLERVEQLPRSL